MQAAKVPLSKDVTDSPVGEPIDAMCMACDDAKCVFKPRRFQRRPLGPKDVLIDMVYCGVCHTDVDIAANRLGITSYPFTAGHELAGICIAVGAEVSKIKVGSKVGVGTMVDSCLDCHECKSGAEDKCQKGMVGTYGAKDKYGRAKTYPAGGDNVGGYSSKMVVHEHFALLIPESYPLECVGPMMCSGSSVYEPLRLYKATTNTRVGIVGLGGLGVMGIKLAKARGCIVTAISRTHSKDELAKKSGADKIIASSDGASMTAAKQTLDLVINTIPIDHDWAQYVPLLAPGGTHVFLGIHTGWLASNVAKSCKKSCCVKPSLVGGLANTQEVVDLCAKNEIYPEIEIVPVDKLSEVYTALEKGNAGGKRFVLDIKGSLNDKALETFVPSAPELNPKAGASICGTLRDATRMVMFY